MTVRKRHVAGGTFSVNLGRRKEREVEKVRGARREGFYIVYRCLQNAGYKASFLLEIMTVRTLNHSEPLKSNKTIRRPSKHFF